MEIDLVLTVDCLGVEEMVDLVGECGVLEEKLRSKSSLFPHCLGSLFQTPAPSPSQVFSNF